MLMRICYQSLDREAYEGDLRLFSTQHPLVNTLRKLHNIHYYLHVFTSSNDSISHHESSRCHRSDSDIEVISQSLKLLSDSLLI